MQPFVQTPLRKARLSLGLTTEEAGHYVHVTRKTWEAWENAELNGRAVPAAKAELFFRKLDEIGKNREIGELVVVLNFDPYTRLQTPIDVVAEHNYLGLENGDVIKSLAIRRDGQPYVHRTKFVRNHNAHVLEFCQRHSPV